MDDPASYQFISSLVKTLQALCNGCINFSSSVEVVGHIHLNIDGKMKLDYVLTEEVSKSVSEDATLFSSHSYHSKPPPDQNATDSSERTFSPPSGSNSNTASASRRRKTHQVPRVDDSESFSFTTVPQSTSVTQNQTTSRASEGVARKNILSSVSNSWHRKQQDSQLTVASTSSASGTLDRRRKSSESAFQTIAGKHQCVDDMEIKLEPEDVDIKEEIDSDDGVVEGALAGQDLGAPDFSCVMVESLDHADQNEVSTFMTGEDVHHMQAGHTTSFMTGESEQQIQYQPYPVVLHTVPVGSTSSRRPVPSTSTETEDGRGLNSSGTQVMEMCVQTPYKVADPLACRRKKRPPKAKTAAAKSKKKVLSMDHEYSASMEKSNYLEYSREDMEEAIELVHGGLSVIEAALEYGIPRATLFNRSREGCKTHSGRCSEVFLRTHVGNDGSKKRAKSKYTPQMMENAIEAIHRGTPVIDAAIIHDIPRASLFIRSSKGCPTHPGRCSTVSSNGKLKRTKVARFRYLQLVEEKRRAGRPASHSVKGGVRQPPRLAPKPPPLSEASTSESCVPPALNPQVKLTKIQGFGPDQSVTKILGIIVQPAQPVAESSAPATQVAGTPVAAAPAEVVPNTGTSQLEASVVQPVVETDQAQGSFFETLNGSIVVKMNRPDGLRARVSSSLSMEFREYKKYSQADAARALHLVHMGLSLSASQMQTGVPMTTIFRMTKRCQQHRGNCRGAYVAPSGHP